MWTKIGKIINILGVTHESVPWGTLNGSGRIGGLIQLVDESRLAQLKAIFFLHLLVLANDSVGLANGQRLEEVWQVLIHFQVFSGHRESGTLQHVCWHDDVNDNDHQAKDTGQEQWGCLVDFNSYEMAGQHVFSRFVFVYPDIIEELAIVNEPETIEEQTEWTVFQN